MVRRWDLWQPGLAVVDVTNPAARKWYEEKLEALIDLGVDTFKVSSWAVPPQTAYTDKGRYTHT